MALYERDVKEWLTLSGQVVGKINVDNQTTNILGSDLSHGSKVATVLLGKRVDDIRNGIAPGAKLLWFDRNSASNLAAVAKSGARILNISMTSSGVQLDSMSTDAIALYREYLAKSGEEKSYRDLRDANVLIVHAAGNSGKTTVRAPDALPAILEGLNNWLLVTALDDDGENLAPWATACGDRAKAFCLAAPGSYEISDPDNPGKRMLVSGSSFATPIVSGVAALVMEAFPWMSADQVAQTILTTTTDLGESGVDAVFGHGRVNADKATKGPAVLTSSFEAAVPTGTVAVFGNDIDGGGSLTKSGGGSLRLSGLANFTGGVTLNGGSLALSGKLNGNLTQHDGTLILDVARGLQVQGDATVSNVSFTSSGWIGKSWSGEILTASSLRGDGLTSEGQKVFYSEKYTARGNVIEATLTRRSGTSSGLGDQSMLQALRGMDASLAALDAADASSQQRMQGIALMDIGTRTQTVLDSMAGQAHATSRAMTLEAADIEHRWSLQRAQDSLKTAKGGLWVMNGMFDSQIRTRNSFNSDVRSQLFSAGVDHRVSDRSIVGLAANISRIRSNFERFGGDVATQGAGILAYATLKATGPLSITGYLGASALNNDV